MHVDADVLADDTAAGRAYVEGGPALTGRQTRRMLCEATVVGMIGRGRETLDLGRRQRRGTKGQRRALLRRDGGCARPGCPETRLERLHMHHMRHWLFGGRTDIGNLVLLCDVDHGLVHEHDLVLSRRDGRLIVTAPDGTRLWGSADAAFLAGVDAPAPDPASGDDAYAGVHPVDTTIGRRPPSAAQDERGPGGTVSDDEAAADVPSRTDALHRRRSRPSTPPVGHRHRTRPGRGLPDTRDHTRASERPRPGGPRDDRRAGRSPSRAPRPVSASAESGRLDRILFPDGAPPRPTPRDVPYERLNMAWAIGVLMDHREFVRRREADRGSAG
ncbi:HNH endonuclease [Blastococcus fimeti]|nr:HNH endonuclease [Blastococcus fimeti]